MKHMTLNEIVVAALSQLERGNDPVTLERWRPKLVRFANDGVLDLICAFKPTRRETVKLSGSVLDTTLFDRPCIKVERVLQKGTGFELKHSPQDASGIMSVRGVGEVDVIYRYMPRDMAQPTDEPELPLKLHPLIVLYVVARERMSGDVSTQSGANPYLQLYEAGKLRLLSASNDVSTVINKFGTSWADKEEKG